MREKLNLLRRFDWLIFLIAAVALFFWPVWIVGYTYPTGGGDLWGQLHPVWSFVARHLPKGRLPLWYPLTMAGDPIVGEPQYGLLNPVNWPFFLLASLPRWAVLLRGMVPLLLAGVGLYLYLRHSDLWRLGKVPALVGSVAYMFSDTFIVHLGHPQLNEGWAWLPFALLMVDKVIAHPALFGLGSPVVALLAISGHSQTVLFGAVTLSLYAAWRLLTSGRDGFFRRGGALLAMALLAGALSAPVWLPAFARYPFTERSILQLQEWHGYQWNPRMLVDLVSPWFHGRGVRAFWADWARVENGYVGVVALALALWGAFVHRRESRVWFLLALVALTLLFALGYDAPLYRWLSRFDFVVRIGKTARAITLLSFALAVLAALGVHALRRDPPGLRVYALVLALAGLLLWWRAPAWTATVPPGEAQGRALEGLRFAALLLGATALLLLLHRWSRRATWRAALLLLLLAELVAQGALVETEPLQPGATYEAALDVLRSDPGWFRVDVDASARGLVSPAGLQAEGFAVPQGTGNPMELFAYNQFYWAIPYKGAPAYRLLGAKYIIVPSGAMPGGEGIVPVFTDHPLIDLHLNTRALPRAWLVYRTHPIATIEEAYDRVLAPDFAPDQVAFVEKGPTLDGPDDATGAIGVLAYAPNHVKFRVRTSDRALLVLSDFLYPGWQGFLDGKPASIYRTDVVFRAMVVPAGVHEVEMRFRPPAFRQGLGLAGMAGLVIIASVWVRSQRKRE